MISQGYLPSLEIVPSTNTRGTSKPSSRAHSATTGHDVVGMTHDTGAIVVLVDWARLASHSQFSPQPQGMHYKEEYRFQGKFSMKGGRITFPQIPRTWFEVAGDLRLDFNYYHEHGGCDKIDKRETCFGGRGKLEVSYCGGAPSVLQGCIKASIDCCGKGCLSLKTGVNNNSNCTLKISTECCYGPFCRESEIGSWDIFSCVKTND